jgi:tRNA nucleotidyltransferase (CCA-adding enzyme)
LDFKLPSAVDEILEKLKTFGYEAYVVGGCVRDCIMGKTPHDWDIATNALPNEVIECFKEYKVIETGLKHGTVTVLIDGTHYEITTFRIDGDYLDNRRPDNVTFTRSIKEDLSRRDFTINAIAYNPAKRIIDPFGGCKDIENKKVRCVGNPNKRFGEDALRILRALRFSSVLGFEIEKDTALSIHKNKNLLLSISAERIRVELCKLLMGANAKYILESFHDVLSVFIPEIKSMVGFGQNNPYHHLDVWRHTIQTIISAKEDIFVRLSLLFHDIGKPLCYSQDANGIGHFYGHQKKSADLAHKIMQRLRFDNKTIAKVGKLVLYHDTSLQPQPKQIRRLLNKIGPDNFRLLLWIKRADICGQAPHLKDERLILIDKVEQCMMEILQQGQCFSLEGLDIDGRDLVDLGVKGPLIGKILNKLLEMVIDEEIENRHSNLIAKAKELIKT